MTPRDGATRSERSQRIVVVGPSCSGKSTLAARLAGSLDAPFVELDALYWRPNWVGAPDDEFATSVIEATAGNAWVVAGSYTRVTRPHVWPRADCVIWLDLPLHVTLPRMVRRTWRRWRTRELLWGTNVEEPWQHLRLWEVDRNLFSYAVVHHRARRRRILAEMADPQWVHIRFVQLRSPQEVEAFAREFEARGT